MSASSKEISIVNSCNAQKIAQKVFTGEICKTIHEEYTKEWKQFVPERLDLSQAFRNCSLPTANSII